MYSNFHQPYIWITIEVETLVKHPKKGTTFYIQEEKEKNHCYSVWHIKYSFIYYHGHSSIRKKKIFTCLKGCTTRHTWIEQYCKLSAMKKIYKTQVSRVWKMHLSIYTHRKLYREKNNPALNAQQKRTKKNFSNLIQHTTEHFYFESFPKTKVIYFLIFAFVLTSLERKQDTTM